MAFWGNSFTFDNISSERYNLKITTPKSDETINISEYKSDLIKTPRRTKFYATKQRIDEPLTLAVSIYSETPLTRNQIDQIERWLFRTDGQFRKLRINQEDMRGYYYNCRLENMEVETFGNLPYQVNCILRCDSQYAWQNQQTRAYSIATTPYLAKFVNISSEDLMSPTYIIKCNSANGTIKIVNNQYADARLNTMEFMGLQNGEILSLDTEYGIITSNLRTNGLLDLFVYPNFMKLPRGANEFTITGNISEFKLVYENARKFGA